MCRVLSAAGAVVVKGSELGSPGVNDRLNLVLTDPASLANIRDLVGPGTPVATYLFVRDVLLKVWSTAIVQ